MVVAYWMVLDTQGGFPTKVRQLPADEVTQDAMDTDAVRYKGQRLMKSHPAGPGTQLDSVITFQSFAGGILANGCGHHRHSPGPGSSCAPLCASATAQLCSQKHWR